MESIDGYQQHMADMTVSPARYRAWLEAAADVRAVPLARATTLPATAGRPADGSRAHSVLPAGAVIRRAPHGPWLSGRDGLGPKGMQIRGYALNVWLGCSPRTGWRPVTRTASPTPAYQRCVVAPEVW